MAKKKKKTGSLSKRDREKLFAALDQAEKLIQAVRRFIQDRPNLPVGSGGGRPCSSLINAEGKLRTAELSMMSLKPSGGGGAPCTAIRKASGSVFKAEKAVLRGPSPCPPHSS